MNQYKEIMLTIVLIVWLLYCIFCVYRNRCYKELLNIMKKTIIETYKYSLNLLTIMFLIIFYVEFFIKIFFSPMFSVAVLFERNPIDKVELIMIIPTFILLFSSIIWWTNKVSKIAGDYLSKINCFNEAVTLTIRLCCLIIFIFFHGLILIPMFSYGLAGVFGNPRIAI